MSRSRETTIAVLGVSLAALAVMVGALWPRSTAVVTDTERADHIASQIRCPFCNGESIAEATSQVARDLQEVIEEQVGSGMSDAQIYDFFAARYGEGLLLGPPLLGWGWALWVLPLLALVLGAGLVARQRRRPVAAAQALGVGQVEARLEAVARDRAESQEQLAEGELDVAAATSLGAALEREQSALSLPEEQGVPGDEESATPPRSRQRAVAGTVAVMVAITAVTATLLLTARDEDAQEGVAAAPPIDLSSVTSDRLEEVVAANPELVPMRLALAHMLLDEGEVLRAAQHFGEVLSREQNPEAMAGLGWISYLAGQHETAEGFLLDALAIVPDYPQAQWWLANVRLLGLNDPAGARGPLERVLASEGVPDDVRRLAEDMLQAAVEAS